MKYLKLYETFTNDLVNENKINKIQGYFIGPNGLDTVQHFVKYLKTNRLESFIVYEKSNDAVNDARELNSDDGIENNYIYSLYLVGNILNETEMEQECLEMGTNLYDIMTDLQESGTNRMKAELIKNIKMQVKQLDGFKGTISSYANNIDIPAYAIIDYHCVKDIKQI